MNFHNRTDHVIENMNAKYSTSFNVSLFIIFSCMFSVLPCFAVYCEFKQFWLHFSIQDSCDFCCILQIRNSGKFIFYVIFEPKNLCLEKNCPPPLFLVNFQEKVIMKNKETLKDVEYFAFLSSMTWSNIGSKIRFFTWICKSSSTWK